MVIFHCYVKLPEGTHFFKGKSTIGISIPEDVEKQLSAILSFLPQGMVHLGCAKDGVLSRSSGDV